jgi:uncharacterized protein (TIGR02246 family)
MAQDDVLRGPARTPEDGDRIFMNAIARGDVETIVALYEPDAVFIRANGMRAHGHAEIRAAVAELAALKAKYEIHDIVTVLSGGGDVAVTRMRYVMSFTRRDGKPASIEARTMEVMRRQADGSWRFVIDSPAPDAI